MARMKKKPVPLSQPSARRCAPSYHEQITPGVVNLGLLATALDELRLDPAIEWLDDDRIQSSADRVADKIYPSYLELFRAYHQALYEVQRKMGDSIFNRLEGAGAAVERRLVLAAYFIGVRCGRTMPIVKEVA